MGMFSRIVDRMNRQGTLMGGMMERLDVDLEGAAGVVLGQQLGRAARLCQFCAHGEVCKVWQETHAASDRAPAFCPNAALWDSLRHTRH
jgi:hypothetical protein